MIALGLPIEGESFGVRAVDPTSRKYGEMPRISCKWMTDITTERDLTAFSQRARDVKKKEDPPAVLSNIVATVSVLKGTAHMSPLVIPIPGAAVRLDGDFNLEDQNVHMTGELRMHSDISHVTTGFKALLLKPLAPFFKKNGAGAVVPIAITGTVQHFKISQNIVH